MTDSWGLVGSGSRGVSGSKLKSGTVKLQKEQAGSKLKAQFCSSLNTWVRSYELVELGGGDHRHQI